MSPAGKVPAVRVRVPGSRRRPTGADRGVRPGARVRVEAAARVAEIRALDRGPTTAGEVRLLIFDDGRRLHVDAERVSRLGLEPGLVLAPPVLTILERDDAYRHARETAVRLLAARPRSIAELRERLRRAGVPAEPAAAVVGHLADAGYLDDLEFARSWVRGRLATHPCGLLRLRSELREKGVPSSLIEQAIREVHGEEDVADAEERRARDVAVRRLHAYAHLPWEARVRRLAGVLQRRGFAAQTIVRVLRTVQRQGAAGGRPEVLRQTGSDRGDTDA